MGFQNASLPQPAPASVVMGFCGLSQFCSVISVPIFFPGSQINIQINKIKKNERPPELVDSLATNSGSTPISIAA